MTTETPGRRLAAWRKERGLSLKEAGELFGVAAPNVLAYENDTKRPSAGARRELLEAHTGIPADAWASPAERKLAARARAARADAPDLTDPPPSRRRRPDAAPKTRAPSPAPKSRASKAAAAEPERAAA